jgi:hypothetical protein
MFVSEWCSNWKVAPTANIPPASFFPFHRLIAMQPGKVTDKHNQLSDFYKALAHPARLAIH